MYAIDTLLIISNNNSMLKENCESTFDISSNDTLCLLTNNNYLALNIYT